MRAYRNVVRRIESTRPNHLSDIINSPRSHKTRELRKAVIDDYLKWMHREGRLRKIPRTEIISSRAERQRAPVTPLPESELLDIAGKHPHLSGLLRVGFYMGLRISELTHCRPAWVVDGRFLRIGDLREWDLPDEFHPKSQKEYDDPIAIPKEVRGVLRGKGFHRLFGFGSTSSLRSALKECLPEGFTPHHLRHSCISYWLNDRCVPIQEVQRLARHARIETTMRYFHPDSEAHWRAFN